MPVTTSGRIIKTRKAKKGTLHQKNHRWESFTSKISKLSSLDPIRRVRRHDIEAEDLSTNTSYFKNGLQKWQELNMSEPFSAFSHEVQPMCDSLPQIIHFEDQIMQLLVTYVEKRERESLEPLLELMSDFAHDIGPRFEKHYPKALQLVTSIAATPQDVEVIEWSFTSLAFLFKYLSKLVVPDLRPTYDLIAPLLGKHQQQAHIARFAAEAMSFLVRKAGAPAQRGKALPMIVTHSKLDLQSVVGTNKFGLYYHGIMTLFAEAIKGNGLTVHTSGPAIFRALILAVDESDFQAKEFSPWMNVVCGVLTSIIHHTSSETFKEILGVVREQATDAKETFTISQTNYNLYRLILSTRMMGVVAGVRKGTRVDDWPGMSKTISDILWTISRNSKRVMEQEQDLGMWDYLCHSVSVILQYAPMDAIIPYISPIMDSLTKDPLAKWFLTFSSYISKEEPERFRSINLPYFQKFVIAHWSDADNGDTLSVLLPKMVLSGVLPSAHGKDGFVLPQSWQDQIVSKFERLEVSPFPEQASPAIYDRSPTTWHDRCLPKYNALLEVLESTKVHPSTTARIAEILLRKLKLALRPSSSLAPEEANFIVGRGFSSFSKMTKGIGQVDQALEPLLRAAAPRYARLPNFLEALMEYETSLESPPKLTTSPSKDSGSDTSADLLVNSLISNLATGSHELRLLSLQLLGHIYTLGHGLTSEALSIMTMVEQTPLDLQTARSASMHIRKLAAIYPSTPSGSWLKQAIPTFCFGMLTVKFAQIWEDASMSLKQIADSKVGEEIVAELAFDWLETPSKAWDGSSAGVEQRHESGLTDFECSNLTKLDQVAKEALSEVLKSRDTMLQNFAAAQELVAAKPNLARAQALRVLSLTPAIAEKRSRQLVPMFLSWARKQGNEDDQSMETDTTALSDWTRKDQKVLLDLFGLFTNPKSLYKSDEVLRALLNLLSNGDIDMQKSALKAIFTWKNGGVKPYEENLLNLLDESRFKDEITIMLQGETLVQLEHRASLMPVLLRLLYGRSISRKGAASGKQGLEARRLTVLRNLRIEDAESFLGLALGKLADLHPVQHEVVVDSVFSKELISVRKQVGFTSMAESMLKELGSKVLPFAQKLVDSVLYCIISASRQLKDQAEEVEDTNSEAKQTSLLRDTRQTGLKCLILLFQNVPQFEWLPYMKAINTEIISPRLENLPIETAQDVSVILRLLATWSTSEKTVIFLGSNTQILIKVSECLTAKKTVDKVKLFALSVIKNVIKMSNEYLDNGDEMHDKVLENPVAAQVKRDLLTPNMDHILVQISYLLHQDATKEVLESCVETVSQLAPLVSNSTQARNLVDVSTFLLDQPSRRVSPKIKGALLLVLEHFVPLYDLHTEPDLKDRVFGTITSLFGYFKDKKSREVLSRVLMVYSKTEPVMREIATLCVDLNSFLMNRLDEPDYDRRTKAFNKINSPRDDQLTARQWTPLLFNMLFYIRHDEEHAILSTNSSDGICQFIDTAARTGDGAEKSAFMNIFSSILLPALFSGAREPSEVVRLEYLRVMAHLIRTFPTWGEISDMYGLLAGDDEIESSFFKNILTAGKGRQSSALGQLTSAAGRGELSSKNISHFFIPLIEHFIFDRADGSDAHNLAAEATNVVGTLAESMEWQQYRAMLRRYLGFFQGKPELEKQIIRLLSKVIDGLAIAIGDPAAIESDATPGKECTLAMTVPKQEKFADDLTSNILPPLTAYLHDKDESTVSLRAPIAIIIVRLLKLLPREKLNERLPPVLTDICHILRSKAQESRNLTRDTLTKICILLGPSCFGFVLKELRGALARGYQLHVLSYTMHSILVATIPQYGPGDLDYCLPSIVAIIMDDIFGATGQEKDAEEYVSKMIEVKKSTSHDSMELIAKTATLSRLTELVRPIQVLLKEKLNLRMVRKIDELLNRISRGLLDNPSVQSRDSLIFCYEVIQDVYNSEKPQEKAKVDYKLKKYLIQKGAKKSGERGSTTVYTYKLVRFAFDVLRSVLRKHETLRTSTNLVGFVAIIGDAIVKGEEEVKVAAFKLLDTISKVPLKVDGTDLYRLAVAEASKSIAANLSTSSDTSQAALKLITVVLRDRKDVPVKESSVDDLLTRLKEDLTKPEQRDVTFKFLKAVLYSRIETAQVYDTLDYVGTIMVTNDDNGTRDLARGAYFQFLSEYPQKKKRWSKQLDFIVGNLKYDREGGRLSVLEVIHLLLSSKMSNDFVQEVSATCFPHLVLLLANDESEKCRMGAGEVMKEIFQKADNERMNTYLTLLQSWINQPDNPSIVRLGLQTYGFYFDSADRNDANLPMLLNSISSIIKTAEEPDSDWEQIFAALRLALILVQKFPGPLLSSKRQPIWAGIRKCLSYPHAWVKISAARLTNLYLVDFAKSNIENNLEGLPLKGSSGLTLRGEDILELTRQIVHMFKTPNLTFALAEEIVKNLAFLARCAGANSLRWHVAQDAEFDDEADEKNDSEKDKRSALDYLFERLSFLLRREISPPRAQALIPKTAALQLVQLLTSKLELASLIPCLETILLPLHNLTDSSIPTPYSTDEEFKKGYQELKSTSEEIMEDLKRKVGTRAYTEAILGVREGVKRRREGRSVKRKVEAVREPENWGENKRKKGEKKKEKRKERGMEHKKRRNEF